VKRLAAVGSAIAVALLVTGCGGGSVSRPVANALVRASEQGTLKSASQARRVLPVVESRAVPRAPLATAAERVELSAAAETASQRLTDEVDTLAGRVAATPKAESDIRRCAGSAMEAVAQDYGEGVVQGDAPDLDASFEQAMSGCLSGVYPAEAQAVELVTQSVHAFVSATSQDATAAGLTALQYYAWLRTAYQPSV
jgi:hypothetical protein